MMNTNRSSSVVPGLPPHSAGTEATVITALVLLALGILSWRWVGYQGHDDASYAAAAMNWVENFPPLGTTHWALRYPLVLPSAALIAVFGPSIAALVAVNIVTYTGFLVVNYLSLRRWFGWKAAAIGTLVCLVVPEFPVQATYANPDLPEVAFTMSAFWALMLAREKNGAAGWLVGCGVLAGVGFLTRETSILLVPLFGLMFLINPAMPRRRYFLIALGFSVVVGMQSAYFAVRTGDPFYRLRISAHHDNVDRSSKINAAERNGQALDSEGVLVTDSAFAPLSAILVSQKYGLLFILAVPAYGLIINQKTLTRRQRDVLNWTAVGALVAFLFIALNSEILYVVPRYFMVSAAFAVVPLTVLTATWLHLGRMRQILAIIIMLGFLLSSTGLLYLENVNPMMAERHIVNFVSSSQTPVHIDPETARRIHYLLLVKGLLERTTVAPPHSGDLVASEDGVVNECLSSPSCEIHATMAPFAPGPGWVEVKRFEPPRRAIARLLDVLGIQSQIPNDILRKIIQPGSAAVIYRAG